MDAELIRRCQSILEVAKEGEGLVKSVHDCLHLLESRGFVYNITLHPSMVGISPLNRDGSGVNAVDVHELLSDILSAGFLEQRVHAVGVEPRDGEEILWNTAFFQAAHGMLGHFDPSAIKCLSLAGSHTNCVLRILGQEILHDGDESICHDGKLNLELLRKKDEAFYRAATHGVNWKVLRKEAAMHLPHLLSMIQRTGNATMQSQEHELQLMRRLHGLWVTESTHTKHVDFLSIKKKAFVRRHSPSTRSLGAEFWEKISMEVKGTNQFSRVKLAYAKEVAQAGDAKRMMHKDMLTEVRAADLIMYQWRQLVERLSKGKDLLALPELITALNFADMHLIGFLLKLPVDVKQYSSKEALAHDVVVIMRGICGQHVDSPWEAHAMQQKVAEDTSSPKVVAMRELNPDGTVKQPVTLLEDAGFKVGSWCRRKSDGQSGQIVACQGGKVQLKQADGNLGKVVLDVFLGGDWSVFTPKPEPVLIPDATMMLDIFDLQAKHEANSMLARLHMHLKPQKKIVAIGKIPKMRLTLVPCSLQLKHGAKVPDDCFEVFPAVGDVHFWSAPMLVLPKAEGDAGFANLAFMIQSTHEEDLANMEVCYVRSQRMKEIQLPLLKNVREIAEGESLCIYKEKIEVPPMPLDQDSPKPNKRMRTKAPADP
ncbi:unnamed protein product [Symbiodinium sp. CCMP2592]|nr:unnamed protein product [Symbiodinium sp. CCMP2592]